MSDPSSAASPAAGPAAGPAEPAAWTAPAGPAAPGASDGPAAPAGALGTPAYSATGTYNAVFAPAPRRRRVMPWIVTGCIALVLAAGIGLVHVWGNMTFDEALAEAEAAGAESAAAGAAARAASDDGGSAVGAASSITASAADDLVDTSARTAFADATTVLDGAVDEVERLLTASVPVIDDEKPGWTWELFAAVPQLEQAAPALTSRAGELDAATAVVDDAYADLSARAAELYASVPAAASVLEAAHISARATVMLDFVEAAENAAGQDRVGSGAEIAFTSYADAAAALKTSSAAELAEKAGPLFDTRLVIEEYARSISGGVTLDFDWAPVVNGVGGIFGMAGTATWNTGRGGFSTITLSDSVAVNWPSADAMALVTHEVGHSITSKCSHMFDSDDIAQNEAWATAWAISMGFTTPGNGTQAYGYPPQELIEVAATCR